MPTESDYKDQLLQLIQLQHMDSQIYDLLTTSETFPVKIQQMDALHECNRTALNKAEDDLKKLQVFKNQRETDMQAKEDLIKKHQSQLFQIKNNKEYSALQAEIHGVKADISLIEEDIINLFDKIDAAKKAVDAEKKAFEDEKKKFDAEKALIMDEEKKINDELQAVQAKRVEVSGSIDKTLLGQYERILRSRGRTALAVVVDDERCGECRMLLRPQIINEAKLKRALVLCENCSRMLYTEQ